VRKLTTLEIINGALAGVLRAADDLEKGLGHSYGADPETRWQRQIAGALAEVAVAKHFGRYWNGCCGVSAQDVIGLEVRYSRLDNSCLLIKKNDRPDDRFVLVTGLAPEGFAFRGWLYAREGQLPKYWEDRSGCNRPAFFVPQSVLRPMEELRPLIVTATVKVPK
jgi:hypothetical protein